MAGLFEGGGQDQKRGSGGVYSWGMCELLREKAG